ncbi:MAG: PEGA domain-containing protein [Pseudomonadota bacterium]
MSQNEDNLDQPQGSLEETIEPVAFQPSSASATDDEGRRIRPFAIVLGVVGVLLGTVLWFVFSAKAVLITVDPAPDTLAVEGGSLKFELGGRHMLRKGSYTVTATKEGFHPLEQVFEVGDAQNQELVFDLKMLPGRLSFETDPGVVTVVINEEDKGETDFLELDRGEYTVLLRANGYLDYETQIAIEGKHVEQTISASLTPAWAPVTFSSKPEGVNILIDEEPIGVTPMTGDVPAGSHLVTFTQPGYKTWRGELTIEPDVPFELPEVLMERADGSISVTTNPSGASISIGGKYYGRSPIKVSLPPNSGYNLLANKPGYKPLTRSVSIQSEQERSVTLSLIPNLGTIRFMSVPPRADIYVGNRRVGQSGQKIELPAVAQTVEFRKDGYAIYSVEVTPRPGFEQSVSARLKTQEQSKWDAIPKSIIATGDVQLTLLRPSANFSLGASRREPGRRANETIRPVRLERPFYVGTHEITNEQFRYFLSNHVSGESPGSSLNSNDRPVSHISWQDAARFCNWLSDQEGLPKAYVNEGGQLVAIEPMNNGYRLPTEAEWAWVARYAGKTTPSRYPWGNSLPPADLSGNFADASARELVSKTITDYEDHFPSVAPIGSFAPNPLGFYDLGGNVSEWVHDFYVIGGRPSLEADKDPMGPFDGSFHVIRGSSWMHGSPVELRWAYRDYGNDARPDLGFRVARYVE